MIYNCKCNDVTELTDSHSLGCHAATGAVGDTGRSVSYSKLYKGALTGTKHSIQHYIKAE